MRSPLPPTAIAVPADARAVFDVMIDSFDDARARAAGYPSPVLDVVFAQLVIEDCGTVVALDPGAITDLRATRWVLDELAACAAAWAVDFEKDDDPPATPQGCRNAAAAAREAFAATFGTSAGRLEVVTMFVDLGRDGAAPRLGGDAGLIARITEAVYATAERVAELRAEAVDALGGFDDGPDLDVCADCGGSTAVGTPDPHVCGGSAP